MISPKDAVLKALQYYQSFPLKVKIADLLVEEVEYAEKEGCFYITLGYNVASFEGRNPLSAALGGTEFKREYKLFKVEAATGNVLFMKIKKI